MQRVGPLRNFRKWQKFRVDKNGQEHPFFQRLFFFSLFESGANLQPRLACSVRDFPLYGNSTAELGRRRRTPPVPVYDDFSQGWVFVQFLLRRKISYEKKKIVEHFLSLSSILAFFFLFWNEKKFLDIFLAAFLIEKRNQTKKVFHCGSINKDAKGENGKMLHVSTTMPLNDSTAIPIMPWWDSRYHLLISN